MKPLRLSGVLATREARHRQAIEGQWADVECLERVREDEVERRAQKPLARRAALKTTKTLEGFDWRFNPTINRQQVLHLASCEDHPPEPSRVDLRADGRGQQPSCPSPRP